MAIINASLEADMPTYHGDNYVSNMLKIRNMVTVWNPSKCSYIMHYCIHNYRYSTHHSDICNCDATNKMTEVTMLNSMVPVAMVPVAISYSVTCLIHSTLLTSFLCKHINQCLHGK
jgi:hypothetical protein